MITKLQIKKIHTLIKALGISDELYREILETNYQVDSCKGLEYKEAEYLINSLKEKAKDAGIWKDFKEESKALSHRENMATAKQIGKIEFLWKEVAYKKDKKSLKKSLRKFLERQFKISDVIFLEKSMVSKVIRAIESIKQRKNSAQH